MNAAGRSEDSSASRRHSRPRPVHERPSIRSQAPAEAGPGRARDRFLELDEYRVDREWKRYEGTPQRDLFRELRVRFLERHPGAPGWGLEIGPGPGRFSLHVGGPGTRRVLVDLSVEMLRGVRRHLPAPPGLPGPLDLIQGDALSCPFRPGRFGVVALLGNVVGFAEEKGPELLDAGLRLLAPGGEILVETVTGGGERSRYLHRLPVGAVRRLLAAPINAIRPRIEREGFQPEGEREHGSRFRRFGEAEVTGRFAHAGVDLVESVAVAPVLGSDPERIAAARSEPRSWLHLLELEEAIGRTEARRKRAAALLLAGRKLGPTQVAAAPKGND